MSKGLFEETSVSSSNLSRPVWTPRSAHVAPHLLARTGDLVDLVEEDDAALGQFHIPIGHTQELADQVVHVSAHVARLGKLGNIRLHEGNAHEVGQGPDQVGLTHTRGTQEDHVLLDVVLARALLEVAPDMVVVVADRHGQGLLRSILADHETVQVGLDLGGLHVETDPVETLFPHFFGIRGRRRGVILPPAFHRG